MSVSLDRLLFGTPVHARKHEGADEAIQGLDPALRGIAEVIGRELGTSEPVVQAILEWQRVVELPLDFAGVQAKRAGLLFALWREADVREHYRKQCPGLVADLESRVLPLVMPPFVANQAQSADVLVVLVSTLVSMWGPEDLGAVGPEDAEEDA